MNVSFDFAALHYLNLWLASDLELCCALTEGNEDEKLTALKKPAAVYRVARNVRKKYDIELGIPRFKPILDIIDDLTEADFRRDRIAAIISIRDRISAQYGHRDVSSLTTKFLWLKIKSPIIIYDNQARKALGTDAGDLSAFYSVWQSRFTENADQINAACCSLARAARYAIDTVTATEKYISNIAANQWFKERVFDVSLWHVGNEA